MPSESSPLPVPLTVSVSGSTQAQTQHGNTMLGLNNSSATQSNRPQPGTPTSKPKFASMGAGLFAGASGIFIGHPFDTLKVRLQVGDTALRESIASGEFSGHASGRTLSYVKQLYRGVLPPLLTAGALQSVNFTLYENFKGAWARTFQTSHLQSVFMGGFMSGALISVLTNPIGIIKVQQQIATNKGMLACVREIYKRHSLRGFYRGYSVLFVMDSYGRGIYLWIYEASKEYAEQHLFRHVTDGSTKQTRDLKIKMVSAAAAGCLSWLSVYPLDVIKSRLHHDIAGIKYHNFTDCAKQIYRENGVLGFFRGLSFTMIRAAPVAATILPVYEYTKEFLESL